MRRLRIWGMFGLILWGAVLGVWIYAGDVRWLTLLAGSILITGDRLGWWTE